MENFNNNFETITQIINTLPSSKPKPEENNNNCSWDTNISMWCCLLSKTTTYYLLYFSD